MEFMIPITMFVCFAAVAILRPLSGKLGLLLEAMSRERMARLSTVPQNAETERVRVLLEALSRRLDLVEERLDFTERLLSSGQPRPHLRTPRPDSTADPS